MARFALALVFLAALSCATSPTGRCQLVLFSDDELAQMGAASFDQQKQDVPLASSSRENAYVRCIAEATEKQASAQGRRPSC